MQTHKKKKTYAKGTAVILRTKTQQRKRKDENLVKGRSHESKITGGTARP